MSFNVGTQQSFNDSERQAPANTPTKEPGILGVLKRHSKFIGPGLIASVTFYDPGNWATDLQAGSQFGNAHLFILLLAIIMAVFLQILACRLGFITGKDFSQNCRAAVDARPNNTMWKWLGLYPLWVLLEIAVLFADIGELLGSAIAYNLLVPKIPLWGGVLLTFFDVFLALIFFRKGEGAKKSQQIFEIVMAIVVMSVVIAALILLFKVKPDWTAAIRGFLPSGDVAKGTGATIGPHSILLGANLATMDRDDSEVPAIETNITSSPDDSLNKYGSEKLHSEKQQFEDSLPTLDKLEGTPSFSDLDPYVPPRHRSLEGCKSYLAHATFDIAASLMTLPLIVNSAILVVASTTFYYVFNRGEEEADLEAIHVLLKQKLGPALAFVFAFSLLLSGQAASLTITMAGQSLSAGFLGWETNALLRRLVTRTVGIIPSAIVAILLGKEGINAMLIASQVAISIVLPFSIIPLAYFTGQKAVMSITCADEPSPLAPQDPLVRFRSDSLTIEPQKPLQGLSPLQQYYKNNGGRKGDRPVIRHADSSFSSIPKTTSISIDTHLRSHSFANNTTVKVIAGVVATLVTLANIYAVVQAAQGKA
ncbi:natural resistance-associated macrophage protein-domain-containing protein [Melampsora americana]|nr:natural resistance-associated macrophage protein-domain-containing protein [Melampsora americana]